MMITKENCVMLSDGIWLLHSFSCVVAVGPSCFLVGTIILMGYSIFCFMCYEGLMKSRMLSGMLVLLSRCYFVDSALLLCPYFVLMLCIFSTWVNLCYLLPYGL